MTNYLNSLFISSLPSTSQSHRSPWELPYLNFYIILSNFTRLVLGSMTGSMLPAADVNIVVTPGP